MGCIDPATGVGTNPTDMGGLSDQGTDAVLNDGGSDATVDAGPIDDVGQDVSPDMTGPSRYRVRVAVPQLTGTNIGILDTALSLALRVNVSVVERQGLTGFDPSSVRFVTDEGQELAHEREQNAATFGDTFWVRTLAQDSSFFWMEWGGPSSTSLTEQVWLEHQNVYHFASQALAENAVDGDESQCKNCSHGAALGPGRSLNSGPRSQMLVSVCGSTSNLLATLTSRTCSLRSRLSRLRSVYRSMATTRSKAALTKFESSSDGYPSRRSGRKA